MLLDGNTGSAPIVFPAHLPQGADVQQVMAKAVAESGEAFEELASKHANPELLQKGAQAMSEAGEAVVKNSPVVGMTSSSRRQESFLGEVVTAPPRAGISTTQVVCVVAVVALLAVFLLFFCRQKKKTRRSQGGASP